MTASSELASTPSQRPCLFALSTEELKKIPVLQEAISLASDIFWTIESRKIMLSFNVKDSTVELFENEFSDPPKEGDDLCINPNVEFRIPTIDIVVAEIEEQDTPSKFRCGKPEHIFLRKDMVEYCKSIVPGAPLFNRLVLFVAIVKLFLIIKLFKQNKF